MNLLFHRDVIVAPLASGSRGNCTYIGDGQRGILIDCGISTKQILGRMHDIGLGDSQISAVCLTHEHTDHVAAARVLDDKLHARQGERVPFHLTRGTALGIDRRCRPKNLVQVNSGASFQVGPGWTVEPFTVPHDTKDPVGYAVQIDDTRAGVITDLGRATRLVERHLAQMDIAVVEFNHDIDMLMDGEYPWRLKQRVRGPHGHLSNAQSADMVARSASSRLKHLVLAHLSQDNNTPEAALEAAQEGLHRSGVTGVSVWVAHQKRPMSPLTVRTPMRFRPAAPRPKRVRLPKPNEAATGGQQSLF
jgi:phosphoribosyl 1,2-cyclic phosphodiesterase